jgi:hypothetical protein
MFGARKLLLAAACIVAMTAVAWNGLVYWHHLSFVPDSMNVWWVRHASEETWGSLGLPGDNEIGIIVYDMPDRVRQGLQDNGLAWLDSISIDHTGDRAMYGDWRTSPIPTNLRWTDPAQCPPSNTDRYRIVYPNGCPSITGYFGGYGLPASFDPEVEKMVNKAFATPGSFYAFDRIGILILIPVQERIVYIYSS